MGDVKAGVLIEGEAGVVDSRFLKTANSRLERSLSAFRDWREKCRRWFRFYSNDAWDPADRGTLEEEGRIPVTFNYSLSTINALVGSDMADRKEARFWGVDGQLRDEVTGEWLTTISRHNWQRARGHRIESQAQLDQLITGYGWAQVFVDSTRFPFRVKPGYVDPLNMHPDPDYRDDNLADARYLIHEEKWHREDAIAQWPDKEDELAALGAVYGAAGMFPKSAERGRHYHVSLPDDTYRTEEDERVHIFDYQFRKREPWVAFTDPETGERQQLSSEDFAARRKELEAVLDESTGMPVFGAIQSVQFARDVTYRAWLAGDAGAMSVILEEPRRIEQDMFTYRAATGFREKDTETGRTRHFGLMAVIEEPQRWSAKVLSMIIEMMARNSKGGGFIKPSALVDAEKFKQDAGKPGAWHFIADEAVIGDDIVERQAMQWPQGLERLLDMAVNAIPELSSVTNWIKGTAQTERSNVLISNLQSQSMVVLGPLLDPMSQFRVELHTLAAKMAQQYMDPEEMNRLLGELDPIEGVTHEAVPDEETGEVSLQPIMVADEELGGERPITPADILRDLDLLEYHVAVDLGAASSTAKQALWQLFNQTGLLQKLVEVGFPMQELFPWLIRNMPGIPAEVAKQIAGKVQQQMEAQQEQQDLEALTENATSLPPEQQQQLLDALMQTMQSQQPPPEQPAPAEAA
jgi:hypothetical protein